MENELKVWLEDIIGAIQEINSFLPEALDYAEFLDDLKGRRAIQRNI